MNGQNEPPPPMPCNSGLCTLPRIILSITCFVSESRVLRYRQTSPSKGNATLLLWMARQPRGDAFRKTLAVGGVDGTLEKRFTGTDVRGRVFAKTGYIAGVRSLSGYLLTKQGRWLAASFLFNRTGGDAKRAIDDVCELLIRNL